jgi:hypothetical protein
LRSRRQTCWKGPRSRPSSKGEYHALLEDGRDDVGVPGFEPGDQGHEVLHKVGVVLESDQPAQGVQAVHEGQPALLTGAPEYLLYPRRHVVDSSTLALDNNLGYHVALAAARRI